MKFHSPSNLQSALRRCLPLILLCGSIASTAAAGLERANVYLVGKKFGNGKSLTVNSGKELLALSQKYHFDVIGPCKGTGGLAKLVPPGTDIGGLMDIIADGSSDLLTGTFDNPTGTLPKVLVNQRISGTENIKGIGKVSASLNLKVEILADGQIVMKLTKVKFVSSSGPIPGTIDFQKNSKVVITTAPIITMKTLSKNVQEDGGSIILNVSRTGFQKQPASISYSTVNDTAIAGVDYTAKSGVINFATGQTTANITIPVSNNLLQDGYREFRVILSNPSNGAVIGARPSTVVGIFDDD